MLSDDFLNALVAEFDDTNTIGFALGGSHVRGEASPYSDVDIDQFVTAIPNDAADYRLMFRAGHLVSLTLQTAAAMRQSLNRPQEAIWRVANLINYRILLDKDGTLVQLLDEARDFRWLALQEAADRYASAELAGLAEEAHKAMTALLHRDEAAALLTTRGQALGITRLVATQRGVMIKTEASYFPQVWKAVGADSAWVRYHRIAVGLDVPTGSPAFACAIAGLHLYIETARLMRSFLLPEHLDVVETTVARIESSGLLGGAE